MEKQHLRIKHLYSTSPLAFFGALVNGLVNGAFWGMGPIYALSLGFDVANIALFMSSVVFGGSLLQWPLGHLSDQLDRRLVIFAVSLMSAIAAITVFYMIESNQAIGLLAAFIFGGCAFSIYSLSMAHANDHLDAGNVLEITRGLLLLSGIGATIGPLSSGLLMGWFGAQTLMIYFSSLMLLLASLAVIRRTIGSSISVSEQGDFVIMARSSPVVLELDPRAEIVDETAGG